MTPRPAPHDTACTVVIVDDEPIAQAGMRRLVERVPGFRVVGAASDGTTAVALIRRYHPEIVLLDVQMPGLSGFDVLNALSDAERPVVVFVTAHDEHALRAFDVHAVDYLLKPFTDARFREALSAAAQARRVRTHARDVAALRNTIAALQAARDAVETPGGAIAVRNRGTVHLVPLAHITWIEADGVYVRLHTAARSYLHRESIGAIAARADAAQFVRVHRSALVARGSIRQAVRTRTGTHELVLSNGARIKTSRAGWRAVRDLLPP